MSVGHVVTPTGLRSHRWHQAAQIYQRDRNIQWSIFVSDNPFFLTRQSIRRMWCGPSTCWRQRRKGGGSVCSYGLFRKQQRGQKQDITTVYPIHSSLIQQATAPGDGKQNPWLHNWKWPNWLILVLTSDWLVLSCRRALPRPRPVLPLE